MNGSEIWSLTQLDTKKMNMFENNSLHTILSIKIQDYVSIIEIRKQAEQKNLFKMSSKKRRLTWF